MEAELIPHPTTPAGPVRSIRVAIDESDTGSLLLQFVVSGAVERIAWPAPAARGRANKLWRHTCFEAFAPTPEGYLEYNMSPSGQWASYAFKAYRKGQRVTWQEVTVMGLKLEPDRALFDAWIEPPRTGTRQLGVSAVIETVDGQMSYWALAHPADKPDFHHPESFVLTLPPEDLP